LEIEVRSQRGYPKEDLNRIFDKFYRVQRPDQVADRIGNIHA
jgi:signal transduction histidine kinase